MGLLADRNATTAGIVLRDGIAATINALTLLRPRLTMVVEARPERVGVGELVVAIPRLRAQIAALPQTAAGPGAVVTSPVDSIQGSS